jgi:hypothetical protein
MPTETGPTVGKLFYASGVVLDVDDRLLAHLEVVIGAKLRRDESFYLTLRHDQLAGGGRTAIWLNAAVPLRFAYRSGAVPRMNRHWLDALMATANSSPGLRILEEPDEVLL